MSEPIIIINGTVLNAAQAMTLRAACENFAVSLVDEGLGEDEHGRFMTAAYLKKINEIRNIIFRKENS